MGLGALEFSTIEIPARPTRISASAPAALTGLELTKRPRYTGVNKPALPLECTVLEKIAALGCIRPLLLVKDIAHAQ